jgi:hypothetical protein
MVVWLVSSFHVSFNRVAALLDCRHCDDIATTLRLPSFRTLLNDSQVPDVSKIGMQFSTELVVTVLMSW